MAKAYLFDLDGTLIDTEKYYRICWPKALADFGHQMSDEQALSMRSLGRPYAVAHLQEMFGCGEKYEQIKAVRKRYMEQLIEEQGIDALPGAVKLLRFLKESGRNAALVTATDPERSQRYLKTAGLYEYIGEIISATYVERGKPSPDVYLYACERLGIEPGEAVAFEDSPNGVLSAKRAGCRVVMVPNQSEPDEELKKSVDIVAAGLDEAISLIEKGII